MNTKMEKKLLIALLSVILMIVPVVASCANPGPDPKSETETESGSEPEGDLITAPEQSEKPVTDPLPLEQTAEATSTVSVGGVVIRSQIAGAYSVKGFQGFAVRMGADAIRALAGIAGTPFVRVSDITAKGNPTEFASINARAASEGATVLGAISVDLGQMNGGKFTSLPNLVSVPATLGVAAAGGRTLAVVKVLPGGSTELLSDSDEVAVTVTFNITGGSAAYAVIAY